MRVGRVTQGGRALGGTVCGSGASSDPDPRRAIEQSVREAAGRLGARPASLGFVFASPDRALGLALAAARRMIPEADFVGCSTAGELTERGLTHGGVACLLVAWDAAAHVLAVAPELGEDAAALSDRLSEGFAEQAHDNLLAGRPHSVTVLFGDGLSPIFEQLVVQIRRTTSPKQQIVGAGAGDDGALLRTTIGANGEQHPGGALALHVFSRARWGIGVEHGVQPVTRQMTVTRAERNVVHEIDGRRALEVYRRYAGEHAAVLDGAGAGQFLIENELGVLLFDDLVRVRAPLRVQADGSLVFAGEVPEGSTVCIVRGDHEQMLAAARRAAETAAQELGGARAAGVLVFSCICRSLCLGERYAEEIAAVSSVFENVPIAGFSSYGEIARTAAKLDGYHNNTIVVAAIPE
jgi:hypothetical protein